jgi:hypothetical protein
MVARGWNPPSPDRFMTATENHVFLNMAQTSLLNAILLISKANQSYSVEVG